jgi:cytoskeletal protein RodZ
MRYLITILILCIGICTNADAQSFTQRIQKTTKGKATITIHQDASIDELVNNTSVNGSSPDQTSNKTTHAKTTPTTTSTTKPATTEIIANTDNSNKQEDNDDPDLSKKVIRNGHKVMGYRVQAFAGGNSRADRQKAEQIGNSIKSQFPNEPIYVHFYSPRWICRVGNYRTYEEAHQMLTNLRNLGYSQASIVKGKITVAY